MPGLLVAIGAVVGTAHGLYEVAVAAGVPVAIAWIYPLITDGLALVAYTSTAQLWGSAAGYAWTVVVLAAGLSGLAQACYLEGGVGTLAPAALRFGVGAWPAIAAAIVAHLLHLLVAATRTERTAERTAEQLDTGRMEPSNEDPAGPPPEARERPAIEASDLVTGQSSGAASDSPARDRAQAAAQRHALHHGELPTVSQLMTLAEVSRGTAGDALKALRNRPTSLHLVNPDQNTRTQP